ncbi:sulfate transport system ATP-binding protein [uncultured bacterium]|nr:sulfate transport system ATP-binding protein [uncultured bacterium]
MNTITAQFKLDYGAFSLDVDLRLPSSGVTVFFGHSGSGKTTLLRCIAGLQKAPDGFLAINGTVWQDSSKKIFLPTYQRSLGYVFQEANLFAHLSVFDNLCYGLKRLKQSPNTLQFQQIIELLGIAHLMQRLPERLSGGERQRVAIARALVLNPDLLLMDEPLAALDNKRKQEIMPYLTRLHTELKIPVFYVTHSQQEVAQLADYLVLLDSGKVQAAGLLSETLSRLDLTQEHEAASVWQVTIIEQDDDYHLTRVAFAGGELLLPNIPETINTTLRLQIYARDVSITLEANLASSILNVLPAIITEIVHGEKGQSMVRLTVGNQLLLARITQKSVHSLQLQTGMNVYVQIKSTSLLN